MNRDTVVGTAPLRRTQLVGYALFSVPLAMAALPIYLHAPRFYSGSTALGLAAIGLLFGLARLIDAVTDPLLGAFVDDRLAASGRRHALPLALPLLAGGMVALFHPPSWAPPALWLIGSLVLVSAGYSLASIAYQALAADLHPDPHQRTRLAAGREGAGLAGVLVAALLPGLLAPGDEQTGLARFSLFFVVLLVITLIASWRFLKTEPPPRKLRMTSGLVPRLSRALSDSRLRAVLGVLLLSAGAGAMTATLFPFFVADLLGAERGSGPFLAAYFAAGIVGMPAWVAIGRRLGKVRAWQAGILLAVVAFAGAAWVGPGDEALFLAVCVLSGLALGADLALASALLADLSRDGPSSGSEGMGGTYFGLWNLVMKLALGMAAAVALPLTALLGYLPGDPQTGIEPLRIGYVLVPCALKLAAALLLGRTIGRIQAQESNDAGGLPCR